MSVDRQVITFNIV